jgi:hypothetical protein
LQARSPEFKLQNEGRRRKERGGGGVGEGEEEEMFRRLFLRVLIFFPE